MNIAEKFKQNQLIKQREDEQAKILKVNALANTIMNTMNDEEVVKSIEHFLIEKGAVKINDFGCLCQESYCSWQKGLSDLLAPLKEEWKEKGVDLKLSLRLHLSVEGSSTFYASDMSIAEICEWSRARKEVVPHKYKASFFLYLHHEDMSIEQINNVKEVATSILDSAFDFYEILAIEDRGHETAINAMTFIKTTGKEKAEQILLNRLKDYDVDNYAIR